MMMLEENHNHNRNKNENENENELIKQSNYFFQNIQNNNIPEIIRLFRNEFYKPWEFISEEDYSGKIKTK